LEGYANGVEDFAQCPFALGAHAKRIIGKGLLNIKGVITGSAAVRVGRHGEA
jgi:hypothetical protein